MYFLTAKSTKNSPADAFAYFVPSNVRNGRLFAGLQANRPRFLPLLAGTSFHGSGIGPGSFAAIPSFRPGKEANTRTCEHANRGEHLLFACSRRIPASPLEAVLNRRIIVRSGKKEHSPARVPGAGGCKGLILLRPLNAGRRLFPRKATCGWFWYFCHQKYRESRDDVAGVLYLFSAKSTDRSLRLASRSPRNAARKVRILACSGTRTTDSPRARSGRLAKASAGEGRQRAVCRAATAFTARVFAP